MANVTIGFEVSKTLIEKTRDFLSKTGMSMLDLIKVALKNICDKLLTDSSVVYTYHPIPINKRKQLAELITSYFKTKTAFAKAAKLDPTALSSLLVGRNYGNHLTWKKINDAFEKNGINLPCDLKIKYEVPY